MSIVKNNSQIRTEIIKRIKELEYTQAFICKDAEERGFTIRASHLSNYLGGKDDALSEAGVQYLAIRLGIYINILLGVPVKNSKGQLVYEVPSFNEQQAIRAVNKLLNK